MMNQDPDELASLLAAYALGALSSEERAKVETLLHTSKQAQADLRVYDDALAGFATLVPRRKAPEGLEAKFRARLAAEPPAPVREAPPKRPTRRLILLAAAAAILLFIIGPLLMILNSESRAIDAILGHTAAARVALAPQRGASGTVSVVYVPGERRAVVIAQLPSLSSDKQYQLWFIRDNQARSGGVFSPAQDAQRVLVTIPDIGQDYTLGITIEQAGGAPQPSMAPIFTGKLPRLG